MGAVHPDGDGIAASLVPDLNKKIHDALAVDIDPNDHDPNPLPAIQGALADSSTYRWRTSRKVRKSAS